MLENRIWNDFANQTNEIKKKTKKLLIEINKKNKSVVGWGCPGRCSTLLNFYKINNKILPIIVERQAHLRLVSFYQV